MVTGTAHRDASGRPDVGAHEQHALATSAAPRDVSIIATGIGVIEVAAA